MTASSVLWACLASCVVLCDAFVVLPAPRSRTTSRLAPRMLFGGGGKEGEGGGLNMMETIKKAQQVHSRSLPRVVSRALITQDRHCAGGSESEGAPGGANQH